MSELSMKVLSVLRSNGKSRVSENTLLSQFSTDEIGTALPELEENGLVAVDTRYVVKYIELI